MRGEKWVFRYFRDVIVTLDFIAHKHGKIAWLLFVRERYTCRRMSWGHFWKIFKLASSGQFRDGGSLVWQDEQRKREKVCSVGLTFLFFSYYVPVDGEDGINLLSVSVTHTNSCCKANQYWRRRRDVCTDAIGNIQCFYCLSPSSHIFIHPRCVAVPCCLAGGRFANFPPIDTKISRKEHTHIGTTCRATSKMKRKLCWGNWEEMEYGWFCFWQVGDAFLFRFSIWLLRSFNIVIIPESHFKQEVQRNALKTCNLRVGFSDISSCTVLIFVYGK